MSGRVSALACRSARFVCAFALLLGSSQCASSAPPAHPTVPRRASAPPARAPVPPDPFAKPPPAEGSSDVPFPAIAHERLEDGLELRTVTRRAYPIVELRLVLFAGSASDGALPGVAALTGELLKAGGAGTWSAAELAEHAEGLGSSVSVETGNDSTQISIAVTTGDLDAALDLLAAVAQRPRFDPIEFEKLRQRESENAKSAAKADADWAASVVLYRELFRTPDGAHPYAHFAARPAELARITLADCKRWYAANVTPRAATLVVAGDIDPAEASLATKRVFSGWQGARSAGPHFELPAARSADTVWLVDRPHAAQSEIFVGALGLERSSADWPAATAADQILGGGVAGRLFLDLREKRSLAYHTSSSLDDVAQGPVPLVLSAGTRTGETPAALQALLENARRLSSAAPTSAELGMATRSLSDRFLFATESLNGLARLTAKLAVYGLSDHYFDQYRRDLRALDTGTVFRVAQREFALEHPVLVVAGDAAELEKPLTRFGRVHVVDPEHDFRTVRQLAMDVAPAPLGNVTTTSVPSPSAPSTRTAPP